MKRDYTEIIIPCPRCSNYMTLDELARVLREKGVTKKTVNKMFDEMTKNEVSEKL